MGHEAGVPAGLGVGQENQEELFRWVSHVVCINQAS